MTQSNLFLLELICCVYCGEALGLTLERTIVGTGLVLDRLLENVRLL